VVFGCGGWRLRIERALPVREAVGSGAANDGINVEMDPEDQLKVSSPQGIWVVQTPCNLTMVCSCCLMPGNSAAIDGINVEWTRRTSSKVRQLGCTDWHVAITSVYLLWGCLPAAARGGGLPGAQSCGQRPLMMAST
jgi:hypothetical protein